MELKYGMIYFWGTKAQTMVRFHPDEIIYISIWHLFWINNYCSNLIPAIVGVFSH
jgi:hypothetical protein